MRKLLIVTMVLAIPALASAGTTWYDTYGFEQGVDPTMATPDFTLGPLNGQGNWPQASGAWVGGGGGGGVAPMVVNDPLSMSPQCVELNVGDTQGDFSEMDIGINDPLAAGCRVITVSFDILRLGPATQNMWWWWYDAGSPTYGLQWDMSQATHPFGWWDGAGQAPDVIGQWANLTMTWDFVNNTASSWYNGVLVDNALPMAVPRDISTLTGWSIYLTHDSDTGTGSDVVWIDNFRITADVPEPSVFLLVGVGLLALLRRKK
jgi:hypothetical protein